MQSDLRPTEVDVVLEAWDKLDVENDRLALALCSALARVHWCLLFIEPKSIAFYGNTMTVITVAKELKILKL